MVVYAKSVENRPDHSVPEEIPQIDGYEIRSLIGSGGQGKVYEAYQESTSRSVALKVLFGGSFPSEEHRRRFAAELVHASILSHRGIAAVYDAGRSNGYDFIAYELVQGIDLESHPVLYEAAHTEIVRMMIKVCEGVGYLHRNGIIHRDLKPAHIIIDENNEPKIIDLGSSLNVTSDVRITQTGDFVGTIAFAAPEQLLPSPDRPVDTRCDIYALGLIMYQLLTDQYAYDCPQGDKSAVFSAVVMRDPVPLRKHTKVPRDLETIVLKCLQKDPERRYETVVELLSDLRRFLRSEPISARRDSLLYRTKMLVKRRWPILTVIAISFAVVTASWIRAEMFAKRFALERDTHKTRLAMAQYGHQDQRELLREYHAKSVELDRLLAVEEDIAARSRFNLPVDVSGRQVLGPVAKSLLPWPYMGPYSSDQLEGLDRVADEIQAHRFVFPGRSNFWAMAESLPEDGYPAVVSFPLILSAQDSMKRGDYPDALRRLRAARSLTLDMASSQSVAVVGGAAVIRSEILNVIRDELQHRLPPAEAVRLFRDFIDSEPPFPAFRYAIETYRLGLVQHLQWATYGGGDQPAYVNVGELNRTFRQHDKVWEDVALEDARALVDQFFDTLSRLLRDPPSDVVAQHNQLFRSISDHRAGVALRNFFPMLRGPVEAALNYRLHMASIEEQLNAVSY